MPLWLIHAPNLEGLPSFDEFEDLSLIPLLPTFFIFLFAFFSGFLQHDGVVARSSRSSLLLGPYALTAVL